LTQAVSKTRKIYKVTHDSHEAMTFYYHLRDENLHPHSYERTARAENMNIKVYVVVAEVPTEEE